MANDIFNFDPFVELNAYRDALRQLVESGRIMPRDFMPSAMTAVVIPIDMSIPARQSSYRPTCPASKPKKSISRSPETR